MSEFLNKAPFFKLFIAVAAAVIVAEYCAFSIFLTLTFALVAAVLIALPRVFKSLARRASWTFLTGLGIALLVFAIASVRVEQNNRQAAFAQLGQQGIFTVELLDYPAEKANSVMLKTQVTSYSDSSGSYATHGQVIVYLEKDSAALALNCGDRLMVATTFTRAAPRGNPDEFDYGQYLARQGFSGTGYVRSGAWELTSGKAKFRIRTLAVQCRAYLLDIYRKFGITGDEFGILASLTLGYRDEVSSEMKASYSATGAMHILAVSGLHVGIIFVIFGRLFAFLDKNNRTRRLKPILQILFLWAYALVTGLSPSVSRATLMYSFVAFGQVINRKSYIYNSIFASAFLLLLWQPTLLYSMSFQLSYSAVIAIVYFQRHLVQLITVKNRFLKWLWELTTVSIAAQLGTAPWALLYFHQFPNWFLLSNFVVIPMATCLLYGAFALFLVSPIPYVGPIVGWLLKKALTIMNTAILLIEKLPYNLMELWISFPQMLLLFAAIAALGFWIDGRRYAPLVVALSAFALFVLSLFPARYQEATTDHLAVFSHNKALVVNIKSGNETRTITTDTTAAYQLCRDYWRHHRCASPQYHVPDSTGIGTPFVFDNKRYLILTHYPFARKKSPQALEVDYLIVTKAIYPRPLFFENYIRPKTLIIAADVSVARTARFEAIADSMGFAAYSVRNQGAFLQSRRY